jgi:hypothetical protein
VRSHYFRVNLVSEIAKPHVDRESPTPLASNDPLSLDTSLMQAAEARMRRALGLEGGAAKARPQERQDPAQRQVERFAMGHKRRFVQDGEVPVTVVSSRRDGTPDSAPHRSPAATAAPSRLEAAENALAHEIATRQHAERACAEAQATIHDLQTKLGHAELARAEAADVLHREQETIASLRETIATLRFDLQSCEERLHSAEAARATAEHAAQSDRRPTLRPHRRVPAIAEAADADRIGGAMVDDMDDANDVGEDSVTVALHATPAARRAKSVERKPAGRSKLVRWWIKDDAKPD